MNRVPDASQDYFFNENPTVSRVVNLNEARVIAAVQILVETQQLKCSCQECVLDIIALTLNNTPTRYVVNELHVHYFGDARPNPTDEELSNIVLKSAEQVALRPHHERKERKSSAQ